MHETQRTCLLEVPIESLPPGEVGPPLDTQHPSWRILTPWTDPFADRGAYRVTAAKARLETPHGPAIQFMYDRGKGARALVAGEPAWRDYAITCRVQPQQVSVEGCYDGYFLTAARAGIIFRVQTSRRYYFFGMEACERLVLYRRIDDDWHVLEWRRIGATEAPLTLEVEAVGETIEARCPERNIALRAVDRALSEGRVGFRSLGESRLFSLRVLMSPEEQQANERHVEAAQHETERLGRNVPDAVPAGEIPLAEGESLLACAAIADPRRHDLLMHRPDALILRTWAGEVVWRFGAQATAVYPAEPRGGSSRIYLMCGERGRIERPTVSGHRRADVVADEVVVLDGASGAELLRLPLPEDPPRTGTLLKYDFSFEVGTSRGPGSVDFLVRQWRSGMGGGGVDLWAYDETGALLWHRTTDIPYGHHNAVHSADINRDGEPEVLAGGTCFSAQGDVLWVHDEPD